MKKIPPLVAAFILYNILSFATLLLEVPMVRLFERTICNQHYRAAQGQIQQPDEAQCKIKEVQDLLANIMGWQMSFTSLPGLLFAAYFGRAADKHGKRFVFFLNTLGILAMWIWILVICAFDVVFDVHLAWLSATFLFLGGGQRVFNAMIYCLFADSTNSSDRIKLFFLLQSGPNINRLITPRIAARLMKTTIYLPFIVSISLLATCFLVVLVTNEKRGMGSKATSELHYEPIPDDDSQGLATSSHTQIEHPVTIEPAGRDLSLLHISYWKTLYADIISLFPPGIGLFCLVAFFIKRIAFTSEGFIFQYTSEKFSWPLERTTWLRLSAAAGAVVTTLFICPTLTFLCKKRNLIELHHLDLWIIRGCLAVLVVSFGTAFEATTPTTLIVAMLGMGLGEGLEPAVQGLIAHLTDPSQYSQLFTVVAQVDTLSELSGGPITAALMGIGRDENGRASAGWCFLASASIFAVLAIWSLGVTHGTRAGALSFGQSSR